MNSLHGIQISNDEAAVRGKLLSYRKSTGQLLLNNEPLSSVTFLSRKKATDWATKHGARVSPI